MDTWRQVRLSFHLAHKSGDENGVLDYHKQLRDVPDDQLSLAAVHFLRAHYQEAIDIYKRLVLQNKEFLALHVYIALCYYKLDYYDVSQEVLAVYLQKQPDSLIAVNLKVCYKFWRRVRFINIAPTFTSRLAIYIDSLMGAALSLKSDPSWYDTISMYIYYWNLFHKNIPLCRCYV